MKNKEIYLRYLLQKKLQHSATNWKIIIGEGIIQNDFKILRFHGQLCKKNEDFSLQICVWEK